VFATTLAATQSNASGSFISILFLVVMIGLLYMVMIRPQRRKQQQQRALQSSIDVGDEVVTIGGIYAEVSEVDEETVVLEIADGVEVRFARGAISRKLVFDDEQQQRADGRGTGARGAKDQGADEKT
jgi:preprotein translocase subunit YajC